MGVFHVTSVVRGHTSMRRVDNRGGMCLERGAGVTCVDVIRENCLKGCVGSKRKESNLTVF